MVSGPQISRDVASAVLTDPNFTEPALLLRETEGDRNRHGEFVPGAAIETGITVASAPITGQERLTVPEGLRDEVVRKFWYAGNISALRYGLTNGDRIVQGRLGPSRNRFNGSSETVAQSVRDQYATTNPSWLDMYRTNTNFVIQLTGFGHPRYQRYDPTDGHWQDADTYRAVQADDWGGFVEVMGTRIDPGNPA